MESAMHDPNINRSNYLSRRSSLERSIKHYSNFHQILLVGEGDFSFSSSLANAFGSAQNMVPTSLNSREELLQLYKSAHEPLSNLEKLGAMILHGVDATTMEKHRIIRKMRFHRIVYNFPHAGFHGKEEDTNVIEKHRDLLKMFFKNARSMLSEIGEIHVTHKAYGPYRRWELVKQAEECGLLLKESVRFALEDYPGYTNRRGAGRSAGFPFPLGECRTYKFVLGPDLLYLRKLVAIQVVLSNFSSEASAESFQTAILEPESEMQARMSESLRAGHLELKSKKKARKAAETSKAELESALNRLRDLESALNRSRDLADEALKKSDEFARQRDEALRQKDEACREKEATVQQLNGALKLKENAVKHRDDILRQRDDLARQKYGIQCLKEEATIENQTLKRNAKETKERLKILELKIEKQKPIVSDQLNHMFKAQECLQNIIKKIDGSAYDQPEFLEPLLVLQHRDIDKDLVTSLATAVSVSKLATVASKNIDIDKVKRIKEKKALEDNIVSLLAEKRDIRTLSRSALGDNVENDKDCNKLTEGNGESETDLPRRNGAILDVAEKGLQNAGLDFRIGALLGYPDIVVINRTKGGEEGFGLASALGSIIKSSQLEIAELRRRRETLRAEHDHLRGPSDSQTKDLAEKSLLIQELEEKERAATENVEGLAMDMVATEIGRWREAAEQEAAAGKVVMEEFQEKIATLGRELEQTKQSLKEANKKLISKEEMATLGRELEQTKQSLKEANKKLISKEEMAANVVAVRDAAEKSLQLAVRRIDQTIRRAGWWESIPKFFAVPGNWHMLGTYVGSDRDANNNSSQMDLSEPLLLSGR